MDFKPILRFAVMSDVHYCPETPYRRDRFKRAMELTYSYSDKSEYKGLDALYVVGDFTNTGTREQYEMFHEDCEKYVRKDTLLVTTLANHELHYVPDDQVALADYKEIFQCEPDRHEVINGYHFVSVSCCRDKGPWHDSFSAEKKEFIRTELEKARKDGGNKPIFMFQHPGMRGTMLGSMFSHNEINLEVTPFPQVIDFAGHSHFAANDPREINQSQFTAVGTGSLSDISFKNGYVHTLISDVAVPETECGHMLIVEVDADSAVRIRKLDVVEGDFFENDWYIKDCWDREKYVYTAQRVKTSPTPYFEKGAKAALKFDGDKTIVTFPAAKCDGERVYEYTIRLENAEGVVISQRSLVSDFARLHQADSYGVTFEGIEEKDITAKVYASGFWDNYSEPIYSK